MTTRREMLCLLSATALPPMRAAAQPRMFRVSWLSLDRAASGSPFFDAYREGLRSLGYVEGRNLVIDARWADESQERLDALATDIVKTAPHVIVAQGGQAIRSMARANTPALPVVFSASGNPAQSGLIESYARPGRNMTGISLMSLELVGKRMEVLKELLPSLKRVAIVANPEHGGERDEFKASAASAKALGLAIDYFPARGAAEIDTALSGVVKARSDAIVAFPDAVTVRNAERFAQFALKTRVPAVSGWAEFADRGNLATYGPNLRDVFRRLALYTDKILKGAKPAEIPVELPTSVELVVNARAAKAMGLTISQQLLLRADRVIT